MIVGVKRLIVVQLEVGSDREWTDLLSEIMAAIIFLVFYSNIKYLRLYHPVYSSFLNVLFEKHLAVISSGSCN